MRHPFHSGILVGVAGNCAAQGWELVFFSFNFAPSGPWKELHPPKLVKRHDMVRGLILAGNTSPNLLELRDDTDRVHQARFLPIHWWFPGAHLRPGSAGSKYRPLIGRKGTADRSNFNCSGSFAHGGPASQQEILAAQYTRRTLCSPDGRA
jgi:hypothetical protein